MTEPPDIEEAARKEQVVEDLWGDGERDIDAIAAKVGLPLPEVRRVLVGVGVTTWEGDDSILRLSELAAEHDGGTYLFDVEVMAIDGPMTLPEEVTAECLRCMATFALSVNARELALAPSKDIMGLFLECPENQGGCGRSVRSTKFRNVKQRAVDYFILTVSDIQDRGSYEEAYVDRRIRVHLLRAQAPIGSRVRLRALVTCDPKTRDIVLLSEDYTEKDWRPTPPVMDAQTVEAFTRVGAMPMEVLRGQVAPDMVGRPLVQEARLLTLFSLTRIVDVTGKEVRGSIYEALVGDTKTNKSESARDTARSEGYGAYIQAENASRTGLTYAITERAQGGFHLEWGELVRSHGKYAVLDGLERFTSEMQGQLRAALEDQEVEVHRVVHGRRPCAVRLSITLNPGKDPDKEPDKGVRNYPYRAMAIPDTRPFCRGPDMSRIDLWVVLAREDVPDEDIARRAIAPSRPVDPEVFRKLVHRAWSRRAEDVKYVPTAAEKIRTGTVDLLKEFGCSSIPIAHPGLRDTVCRVAVAFAAMSFSTSTYDDVLVTDKEADRAVDFLRRMYEALELGAYKRNVEGGATVTGGAAITIARDIGVEGDLILQRIQRGSKTAEEISGELDKWDPARGWTFKVVKNQYERLEAHGLIETRRGKGIALTARGAQYVRWLRDAERQQAPREGLTRETSPERGACWGHPDSAHTPPPGDGGAGPQEAT